MTSVYIYEWVNGDQVVSLLYMDVCLYLELYLSSNILL